MDLDGSNLNEIVSGQRDNMFAVPSHNGMRLLFTSTQDGDSELYVCNAKGADRRRITKSQDPELFPSFSKRDDAILYTAQGPRDMDIFRLNLDSGSITNLTGN